MMQSTTTLRPSRPDQRLNRRVTHLPAELGWAFTAARGWNLLPSVGAANMTLIADLQAEDDAQVTA